MKNLCITFWIIIIPYISYSQYYVEYDEDLFCFIDTSTIDWGDFDNDGDLDMLSAYELEIEIYEYDSNRYSNTISIPSFSKPVSASWGDINKDDSLDFVLVCEDSLHIYKKSGDNYVKTLNSMKFLYNPQKMTSTSWGDYDNDGDMDILFHHTNDSIKILNNDSEVFTRKHPELGHLYWRPATWGDYDNDGDLDIAAIKDSSIVIWEYDHDKDTFIMNATSLPADAGVEWGDFDNDDDLDLVFSTISNIYVSENNNKTFEPPIQLFDENWFYYNLTVADIDNDNDNDIIIPTRMHLYDGNFNVDTIVFIFENIGDFDFNVLKVFHYYPTYPTSSDRNVMALCGDFDNDDDQDILISRYYRESNEYYDKSHILVNQGYGLEYSDTICAYEITTIKLSTIKSQNSFKSLQWDFDSGIVHSGEGIGPYEVSWNSDGAKHISLIYSSDSIDFDTLEASIYVKPSPIVSIGDNRSICNEANVVLTASVSGGSPPYSYDWSNGSTLSNIDVSPATSTEYSIIVVDNNMCKAYDTVSIFVQNAYEGEEICLVTVDFETDKNMVVWEKTPDKGTEAYYIHKESNVGGIYNLIGEVGYDTAGIFIDETSSPNQHFDRYKIRTVDTCGNISDFSEYHQTIYLSISQGLPGTFNLEWTPYIGFEYGTYKIHKGNTSDNITVIAELASTHTSYTDSASGIAYYMVSVDKTEPCIVEDIKLLKGSISRGGSFSNMEDNKKYVDINKIETFSHLKITPIPFDNNIYIQFRLTKTSTIGIELYNSIGKKIIQIPVHTRYSGDHKIQINTGTLNLPSGLYFIILDINGQPLSFKIVKTS